jgi:hypothetical protein
VIRLCIQAGKHTQTYLQRVSACRDGINSVPHWFTKASRLELSTEVLTLDTYSHVLPMMQPKATAKLEKCFIDGAESMTASVE